MYAVIYVNMKLRVNQWNIAHENEEDDIYLSLVCSSLDFGLLS